MSFEDPEARLSDHEFASSTQRLLLDSLVQQRLDGHVDQYVWELWAGSHDTGDSIHMLHREPVQFMNGEAVLPTDMVHDESRGVHSKLEVYYPYDDYIDDKARNLRQHGRGVILVANAGLFEQVTVVTEEELYARQQIGAYVGEGIMRLIAASERVVTWKHVSEERVESLLHAAKYIAFNALWGEDSELQFDAQESRRGAATLAKICKMLPKLVTVPHLEYTSESNEDVAIDVDPYRTGGLGEKVVSVVAKKPTEVRELDGTEYLFTTEGGRAIYSNVHLPNGPYEPQASENQDGHAGVTSSEVRVATEQDLNNFLVSLQVPIRTIHY